MTPHMSIAQADLTRGVKYLRVIPPEQANALGIPAEAPVLVSPIVTGNLCRYCGTHYQPLVYPLEGLVEAHHWHPSYLPSPGGIYGCSTLRGLETSVVYSRTQFLCHMVLYDVHDVQELEGMLMCRAVYVERIEVLSPSFTHVGLGPWQPSLDPGHNLLGWRNLEMGIEGQRALPGMAQSIAWEPAVTMLAAHS